MNLVWLLIVVLVILFVAGTPRWGYHSLGWGPSGIVGVILVVLLVLVLLGRL
jgi:Protein of unknown function (DUF3309)